MRKITREEIEKMKMRPDGRMSYARGILMTMNVGDCIFIEPKEWTQKTRQPSSYVKKLARKTGLGWKCQTLLDGSGWVVERVK